MPISMGYYKAPPPVVTSPDTSQPRYAHGSFIHNGYLYLFGGYSNSGTQTGTLSHMEKISLSLDGSTLVDMGNILPYTVNSMIHGVASDGVGYMAEGARIPGTTTYGVTGGIGASFNFSTETWTNLTGSGNLASYYKTGGCNWTEGQYIYNAFGLRGTTNTWLSELLRLDTQTMTITTLTSGPIAHNSNGNSVGFDTVNRKVYYKPGYNTGGYISQFWVYDMATDSWNSSLTPPPGDFYGSGVAYYGGKVFIAGGLKTGSNISSETDEVWSYDVSQDSWKKLSVTLSIPRTYLNSNITGSSWFLSGGYIYTGTTSGTTYAKIDKFDLAALAAM